MLKNHVDLDHRCNSPPGVKLHPPVTLGRHSENFSSETLTRSSLTKKICVEKNLPAGLYRNPSSCCHHAAPPTPPRTPLLWCRWFFWTSPSDGVVCVKLFLEKLFHKTPPESKFVGGPPTVKIFWMALTTLGQFRLQKIIYYFESWPRHRKSFETFFMPGVDIVTRLDAGRDWVKKFLTDRNRSSHRRWKVWTGHRPGDKFLKLTPKLLKILYRSTVGHHRWWWVLIILIKLSRRC